MSPKERRLEIAGTRILVVDSARRGLLPIVAIHGFPGGDHMTLRGTPGFDQLAARTRVVFYDQRGAGRSGGREDETGARPSMARHASDLLEIIEALRLERPIIVAHDGGCQIALRAALEQPAAMSGLALVCPQTCAGGGAGTARQEFERSVGERLEETDVAALLATGDGDADIALRGAMEEIFPVGFLRFGLSERTFMERVTFRRQAYDDLWSALGQDPPPTLADLRVPVMVTVGRYDAFVDLAAARAMAEGIAGARFTLCHESAHWPFIEQPDLFEEAIWSWMEEVAAHIV